MVPYLLQDVFFAFYPKDRKIWKTIKIYHKNIDKNLDVLNRLYIWPTCCKGHKKKKLDTSCEVSNSVPGAGLEPAQPQWSKDFKSFVSTIPPSGQRMSERRDSNPRP